LPLVWFPSPTKPGKGFINADYLSALVTQVSVLNKAILRFNKGYVVQDVLRVIGNANNRELEAKTQR
jgi:hypothetical protein